MYDARVGAEAIDRESSRERQETVAFETGRTDADAAVARPDAGAAPARAPGDGAGPGPEAAMSGKKEKKGKARQETKPFAVVREPDRVEAPEPEAAGADLVADAEAAISAVGAIAGEARDAAAGALESTGRAASHVGRGVTRGLASAQARVQAGIESEQEEWRAAESGADLPDVRADAPLADLAVRIDREADFWRAFAVRSLRPGGPRNVAIAAAGIGVSSGVVLGVVGAFGAILGIESAGVDLVETAVAVAGLLLSAVLMAAFVERTRRDVAARALERAEVAERRLERVAAILALEKADPTRFREALGRLERDPTR